MVGYLLLAFAGALLCNAIPHLTAGLRGEPFPSPFATPSGIGDSTPVTNVLWGAANLFAGTALLAWRVPRLEPTWGLIATAIGFVAIGVFCARHFGKVRQNRAAPPRD